MKTFLYMKLSRTVLLQITFKFTVTFTMVVLSQLAKGNGLCKNQVLQFLLL